MDSVAMRKVRDGAVLREAVELGLAVGGHAHDELEARLAAADPGGVPASVFMDGGRWGSGVVVTVAGSHVDPLPDEAHTVALDLAEPGGRGRGGARDLDGGRAAEEVRGALATGSSVPVAVAAGLGGLTERPLRIPRRRFWGRKRHGRRAGPRVVVLLLASSSRRR